MRLCACALVLACAVPASAQEFWSYWGDGKAELNGYRLTQPRYGTKRSGTAVLIFVTEDMSDSLRVKADPGKHPSSDVYPVMKLNAIRRFQTGIYDYNVMTSSFARVDPGWPLRKVSFSSQEWCGHTYHQIQIRGQQITGVWHSYFDGEADGTETLPVPQGGLSEDILPVLLRGWGGSYLREGESRSVSLLPTLFRVRLEHKPLRWAKATVARSPGTSTISVPGGKFKVVTWTVEQESGPTTTYQIESDAPYRLIRWTVETGEEAVLLSSARLPYWKLNNVGDESYLKQLGLKVP